MSDKIIQFPSSRERMWDFFYNKLQESSKPGLLAAGYSEEFIDNAINLCATTWELAMAKAHHYGSRIQFDKEIESVDYADPQLKKKVIDLYEGVQNQWYKFAIKMVGEMLNLCLRVVSLERELQSFKKGA